ncbi:MAG TPA: ankyrin repeat domain-containing protein [Chthonomonadaceae bacterium]|nr:ankyrin repeat domain-containing protein [Chthonomonadaceae bacterium]
MIKKQQVAWAPKSYLFKRILRRIYKFCLYVISRPFVYLLAIVGGLIDCARREEEYIGYDDDSDYLQLEFIGTDTSPVLYFYVTSFWGYGWNRGMFVGANVSDEVVIDARQRQMKRKIEKASALAASIGEHVIPLDGRSSYSVHKPDFWRTFRYVAFREKVQQVEREKKRKMEEQAAEINAEQVRMWLKAGGKPNAKLFHAPDYLPPSERLYSPDPSNPAFPIVSLLCLATSYNQVPVVRLLLEHGADPNEDRLWDPRFRSSNAECIRLLIEHGADIRRLKTRLWCAVSLRDLEMVRLLLDYKVDVNLKSENGNTALDLLLDKQVPSDHRDPNWHQKAWQRATDKENPELAEEIEWRLRTAGAKRSKELGTNHGKEENPETDI